MKILFKYILLAFFGLIILESSIVFAQPLGVVTKGVTKGILSISDDAARYLKGSYDDIAKSGAAKSGAIVVGGSSRVLGARIGTPGGYAAHHIIPVEMKNHRVIQKIGMDLDEARNGISLPMYPGLNPTLPLHRGSHPAYTQAVSKKLDEIPEILSVSETRMRVNKIQNEMRSQLESGKALHTKMGGDW